MPEDLVAAGGIAEMLGVSKTRADQLTRQKGFPEPAAEVDTGGRKIRVWKREAVRKWAREAGRV
jgi:predicted DNA-binding transcriptional regulator AlpA